MTEERVLQLFAEVAEMQKENARDIKKLQESQKETDKEIQETNKQIRESSERTDRQIRESSERTDRQIEKTDKQIEITNKEIQEMRKTLKGLGLDVDGMGKSIGLDTEEFFYSSLKQRKEIRKIKFDYVSKNIKVTDGNGGTQEIDVLLTNGSYVAIVEVKNKVSQKSLGQLQKIKDNFFYFHPQFKGYNVIPVIAGKIFPENLKNKAVKLGFTVLTQVGNHIEEYKN
jgi:hypothetical protein